MIPLLTGAKHTQMGIAVENCLEFVFGLYLGGRLANTLAPLLVLLVRDDDQFAFGILGRNFGKGNFLEVRVLS